MPEFIPIPESQKSTSIPPGMMIKPNHDFKIGDIVCHKTSDESAVVVGLSESDPDSVYVSSGFTDKLLISVAAIEVHWQNPWLNKSQDES